MDLRDLDVFRHLATQLHFGRAARACHLSPSAVSRAIQRLEERLGQTLFERDQRSVRLTPAGERLRDFLAHWLPEWQEFQQSLREGGALRGDISLYCSVTASHGLLAPLLAEFRARHPGIEMKLHTGDEARSIERVSAGEDDLAIAARPDQLPASLRFHTLASSPLLFIAPRQGPVREQLQQGASWGSVPMILAEQGLSRRRAEGWFRERGERPRIHAQVAGHEAIVSMVALGFGVGVVPALVLDSSPARASVESLDVTPMLPDYDIGLCVATRRLQNPLVMAFWSVATGH